MSSVHRFSVVVALLALLGATHLSATPITLGASSLLGSITPGTPANETNATAQVKFLVDAYNLGTANGTNLGNNPADPQNEVYILYRPSAAPGSLLSPVSSGKVDSSNPVVDLNGTNYQYVLFFQASNAWVYYIGDISGSNSIKWGGDPFSNNSNVNGSVISHYVLFNPGSQSVPDGSSSILLLSAGLLTLAGVRRKLASKR